MKGDSAEGEGTRMEEGAWQMNERGIVTQMSAALHEMRGRERGRRVSLNE